MENILSVALTLHERYPDLAIKDGVNDMLLSLIANEGTSNHSYIHTKENIYMFINLVMCFHFDLRSLDISDVDLARASYSLQGMKKYF